MERETGLVHRPHGDLPVPTGDEPLRLVPRGGAASAERRRHSPTIRSRAPVGVTLRGAAWLTGVAVLVAAGLFGLGAQDRLHHTDHAEAVALAALYDTRLVAAAEHGTWAHVSEAAAVRSRTLAAAEGQLTALQSQLWVAQANAFFGGNNIADLDQCLTGVEQSLNQLSLGDPGGAVASLIAVSSQCSAAEAAT